MGNHNILKFLRVCFTLLLCGSGSHLFSQQGNLLFHHLTQEDGLSDLWNEYVFKDSKGFVWISSINGLNRFDGKTVKRYLPDANDSTSIHGAILSSNFFEDKSSNLWFSTYEYINCYDRKYDCFYPFYLKDSLQNKIIGYHVFHLDALNQLWLIAGDLSIYTFNIITKDFRLITRYDHHTQRAIAVRNTSSNVQTIFTYLARQDSIEEIDFDHEGKLVSQQVLWAGTKNLNIVASKILADGDSVLWIAGENEIVKYKLSTKSLIRTKINDLLTIEHFNDSLLLVSINQQGIWEFSKLTLKLGHQYMPENDNSLSLLTNTINNISVDRDQGLWFNSVGFGLSYAYADKRKFNLYNPISIRDAENSKFSPNGFAMDSSGKIICSTGEGGIFILDKNCHVDKNIVGTDIKSKSRLSSIIGVFQDKKNQLWLSTHDGLSFIKAPYDRVYHVSDTTNTMLDGVELRDGRILFSGYRGGLYESVLKGNTYHLNQIGMEKFQRSYTPLQQDNRGRIWMSESLQKFLIVDPLSLETIKEIMIDGMCSPILNSKDGQTIWVASTSGLYNVDAENLTICKVYNENNGLQSAGINSMLMDEEGKLWLSSSKGLIVFNPETESSKLYTREDGIPSTTFNRYGAHRFDDGEMWFGTSSGITKFYPDKVHDISIDAIPQITALFVNGKAPVKKLICEETESTNITEIQKLTFSYLENTLTFTLNALEYSAPARNKVKYKLDNFDAEWFELKSGEDVQYHLSPKSYSLLVSAANSDGEYSNAIRRLDITITPPFWKRPWFISLIALAILGLAIYIVYLNFSKKLELQKVRLRLYENLHDDVGSRLTAIVLSAEELLQQDKSGNPKVQQISKVAKSIVGNMRRLVWAIDPENDSMNSLVQKIQYDKSLILEDKIQFNIEIDEHLKLMIVPGEIRYQVTSIVSEALNNISKYAQAKNVWIQFSKKDNDLTLVIGDDGVGFNVDEKSNDKVRSSGYGLGNMQKRILRVKGKIQIQSKTGEGTLITVVVPIR